MRVLVTGAYGYIGASIVSALLASGHTPVAVVRRSRRGCRFPEVATVDCDFSKDIDAATWRPRLVGIDAVVNCAGILRERGADTFQRVHEAVPQALFAACAQLAVRRVVQISALGAAEDGEFIASKHRGDAALMTLDLDWVVLRPALVFSTRGAYGGTSLLRALAALPWIPLPGRGEQWLQPMDLDDLVRAVLAALSRTQAVGQCLNLGGPAAMTLRQYLTQWRRWLGLGAARFVLVPRPLAKLGAALAETFGCGPLGLTMWHLLERGQALTAQDMAQNQVALGYTPAPLAEVLARTPAYSADRWHARLHFLAPALRVVLALSWIASGCIGFAIPRSSVLDLFAGTTLSTAWVLQLAWAGSLADIVLGLALLLAWRTRAVLMLMALMVLAYTAFIGVLLPAAWLDPYGGLIKNAVVLMALAIAAATAERD